MHFKNFLKRKNLTFNRLVFVLLSYPHWSVGFSEKGSREKYILSNAWMANFAKYQRKLQWCCKIAAPSAVSDEHGACARLFEGQLVILILRSQLRKVRDVYNDVNYLLFCESTPTQHTLRGYCAQTKKKRDDKLWLCFGLLVSHYYSSPSLLIMFYLSAFVLYATTWEQRCLNTHRCVILMRTSGVFGERYFLGVSAHVLAVIHTV